MIQLDYRDSERGDATERLHPPHAGEARLLTPTELSVWLDEHGEAIATRWALEIRSRVKGTNEDVLSLVAEFLHLLVAFLPTGMGAYREQVETLFKQAAELYGNLGAHRGQAAGEAVEEVQLLREVIFRILYTHPPIDGESGISLRDLLQLNRLIDLGVTYTSVGHTDALFFNLFQGTGVSDVPTRELLDEVRDQVASIRRDLERISMHAAGDGASHRS